VRRIICLVLLTFVWVTVTGVAGFAAATELVSLSSAGEQGNSYSQRPSISADGQYIVFWSEATNLVASDTNSIVDVFLRDRSSSSTERISVTSSGQQAQGASYEQVISTDGSVVAFWSNAPDLVGGDTNSAFDVFTRDRLLGETSRINLTSDGSQSSGDLLSFSGGLALSGDGRFVAFTSLAADLISGDTNDGVDVFLCDRQLSQTVRLSVSTDGAEANGDSQGPAMSADGRFIVFSSTASNLVPNDTNGSSDVFVHDAGTGLTTRVSVSPLGTEGNGWSDEAAISADGRYVAFTSEATNLVDHDTNASADVFVHDTSTGETARVSVSSQGAEGNGESAMPSISADGRFVAFASGASNLTGEGNNFHVLLRDRLRCVTSLLGRSVDGSPGNASSLSPAINADGRFVAFTSFASDLVPNDSNGFEDIFLRDRLSFEDVPLNHWAFYEVGACNMAGIVQGYPDGLYRPDTTITRDQMAVYIARALSGGNVPTGPVEATFPDVSADHWAYDEIEYAAADNVVQGYDDGKYHPDWNLNRGQMAVFIARSVVTPTGEDGLAGYSPPDMPSFTDVPTDFWSYNHIEYCKERGIVAGYPDGTYQPSRQVSRDQMAVYVARAFQLPL